MLGLFDWLFGNKVARDPLQEVKFVDNYVIKEPDGVYDGYAIVKGERISLDGVNPPVITLLKILMRDWKKVRVVCTDYDLQVTALYDVIYEDMTFTVSRVRRLGEYSYIQQVRMCTDPVIKFSKLESNILCNTYIKLVEDSRIRLDGIVRRKSLRKQNKQRKDMDKMLREKYNV